MEQRLLPPMEWLRNSGWGRNISSLAKGDYRKASNEHLWQVFMDRTDDPVTSFVGVARHEAAYGQTGYEAARELAGSGQEELDALAAGMSCECAIANALIPFVEDGQRVVALGADLVRGAVEDASKDAPVSALLDLKRCFYIHLDDTTAKGEGGATLDGILVVGGPDQPPNEEDPEGTSIITEIMPFIRGMTQPGADSPRSLGISIRPDTEASTISEAIREGARDSIETARRLLANDDGQGNPIIDDVKEDDKPRMGLIRLLERNIDATIRYAALAEEQADAWARIIGEAIECIEGRGPVGLQTFDDAAPQDLVAKVQAGGTGANKARQKLSGLGHVPIVRYEIGNALSENEPAENREDPVAARQDAQPMKTASIAEAITDRTPVPRIDRRKERRENRRLEEAGIRALREEAGGGQEEDTAIIERTAAPTDVSGTIDDQKGPVLPEPMFVRSAGPARHDPVLAHEVERILGRCLRDLPSIHSRNWEAAVPPALASMVMRRARVDQMPHERPDGTRKRLASEILPRMEGIPDVLSRLTTEKNANPGLHETLATGRASIMRDVDQDIADRLVHPVHVVVDDDALTEQLLFPGVKRQPVHGAVATTVIIAWRRERTLHLIGFVHEGCMIGLRRVEYDLDADEVVEFDTESDVLDPRDLLDLLWAPVADALLGPVDEWEAWRFERRERKPARTMPSASIGMVPEAVSRIDETIDAEPTEETTPKTPTSIDFESWPALTRAFNPLHTETMDHLSSLMDGNAVSKAVLDFADREAGEDVAGVHNATLRHLASIAANPASRFDAMSSPEIDERDLASCDDADGVLVINDRALYEHASPGIAGLGLPRRENAMCILYRMRRDGISALTLQMEPDGGLNLAQWSRIPLTPRDEDDDLTWYVRGAIAAAICADDDAVEEPEAPTMQGSALPRMETQPISEIVQAFPRRVDDEDEDVLPRRVIAQVRLRPKSMRAAVEATTAWFDATAERHRLRLIADRREEGTWTIEHRSEDRLNPSIWSTTVRLAPDDQNALDIILRTTMTAGVRPRLPILVRDIAEATPTEGPDGPLLLDPPTVSTRNDLVHLLRELQSPDRVLPILVMSEDRDGSYLRDPREIARQSLGAMTVWKVGANATYDMTDALGQEYRTFYGAVRLFQPRFDPDNDNAAKHPRIVNDAGSERAVADMISRVTASTVTRYAIPDASVVRAQPVRDEAATVPAAPRKVAPKSLPVVVPTPPKVPVRVSPPVQAAKPVPGQASNPVIAPAMVRPTATPPAPTPKPMMSPAAAPVRPMTAEQEEERPSTDRRDSASTTPVTVDPRPSDPAPRNEAPALDPETLKRMVAEMVEERMLAMEPDIQKRIDAAVQAAVPEAPPAEPMLDLPVPPPPTKERRSKPEPEPAHTDEAEIERRIETAVAKRFSGLGMAELLGSVATLVQRMDEFVTNAARTPQPVIVHQGSAEAEAQWASERTAFETLLSEAGEETGTANAERDAAVAEVQKLRQALNELRRDGVMRKGSDERRWPENLDGLADWLEANPLPNVVVTTKAYRGMRKIRYEDMERLCRTLELLNGPYVDMRAGEPGARELWEEGLKELRLESKKQTQMGKGIRGGAEYRFEHEARRWEMDYHIRGNESLHNEHDRLLRIYFAYDKEEGRVLIGHMPTHLTTIDS